MKVLVTVPIDLYKILEVQCSDTSLEYNLLRSGLIDEDMRSVTLCCDAEQARDLIDWASTISQAAADLITVTVDVN
jgi:hypothetical protein